VHIESLLGVALGVALGAAGMHLYLSAGAYPDGILKSD